MIESAVVRELVDPLRLSRRARELRNSKRPGCAIVLAILDELHPELRRSRNDWEALVVRRCSEFGLPRPSTEFEVIINGRRYFLDLAWPEFLVALEFDGRDPHMRRIVHDNDTLRRNDFTDAGWTRFGITSSELAVASTKTLQQVRRAIAKSAAER